jgi:arsenate reductase (thioredoxin)
MKSILVLCTGNSCRSQIMEGYLNFFGKDELRAYSAGIEAQGLNPRTVKVMSEDGVDISGQCSELTEAYIGKEFDYILTVCDNAKENCPFFPGHALRIHHSFPDPAKATGSEEDILDAFRAVRDEIKEYAKAFVETT